MGPTKRRRPPRPHRTTPHPDQQRPGTLTVNAITRPTVQTGRGHQPAAPTRPANSHPLSARAGRAETISAKDRKPARNERPLNVVAPNTATMVRTTRARRGQSVSDLGGGLVMGFDRASNGSRSLSTTQGCWSDAVLAPQRTRRAARSEGDLG
jgi:hypothetical protein